SPTRFGFPFPWASSLLSQNPHYAHRQVTERNRLSRKESYSLQTGSRVEYLFSCSVVTVADKLNLLSTATLIVVLARRTPFGLTVPQAAPESISEPHALYAAVALATALAAVRITSMTRSGWESIGTWLLSSS